MDNPIVSNETWIKRADKAVTKLTETAQKYDELYTQLAPLQELIKQTEDAILLTGVKELTVRGNEISAPDMYICNGRVWLNVINRGRMENKPYSDFSSVLRAKYLFLFVSFVTQLREVMEEKLDG